MNLWSTTDSYKTLKNECRLQYQAKQESLKMVLYKKVLYGRERHTENYHLFLIADLMISQIFVEYILSISICYWGATKTMIKEVLIQLRHSISSSSRTGNIAVFLQMAVSIDFGCH